MSKSLQLLQEASYCKQYISFEDLPVGDYIVHSFAIVETKNYGKRIRVDLGDKVVLLPQRYIKEIKEENIEELNQGQYMMTFRGKNPALRNMVLLNFESVAEYTGSFLDMGSL